METQHIFPNIYDLPLNFASYMPLILAVKVIGEVHSYKGGGDYMRVPRVPGRWNCLDVG